MRIGRLLSLAFGGLAMAGCNAEGTGLAPQWQCEVVDGQGNYYRSSDFQAVAAMSTANANCAGAALDPTSCLPRGCASAR